MDSDSEQKGNEVETEVVAYLRDWFPYAEVDRHQVQGIAGWVIEVVSVE
jgi:hypothetical protein